jgi:hypothetical protein
MLEIESILFIIYCNIQTENNLKFSHTIICKMLEIESQFILLYTLIYRPKNLKYSPTIIYYDPESFISN